MYIFIIFIRCHYIVRPPLIKSSGLVSGSTFFFATHLWEYLLTTRIPNRKRSTRRLALDGEWWLFQDAVDWWNRRSARCVVVLVPHTCMAASRPAAASRDQCLRPQAHELPLPLAMATLCVDWPVDQRPKAEDFACRFLAMLHSSRAPVVVQLLPTSYNICRFWFSWHKFDSIWRKYM
jgi:hypothetical protein